ncbi:MAG: hypothetical protein ACRCW0_00665 [Clostridium sp.]
MSLHAFKKTSARESEFKGRCSDTDKYFKKSNFKVNAIIIGAIVVGVAAWLWLG